MAGVDLEQLLKNEIDVPRLDDLVRIQAAPETMKVVVPGKARDSLLRLDGQVMTLGTFLKDRKNKIWTEDWEWFKDPDGTLHHVMQTPYPTPDGKSWKFYTWLTLTPVRAEGAS